VKMSAHVQPISAARFAAALPDLPLSSLHAKAAEIQNSIAHLKQSNSQLKQYAEEGDKDCQEAIDENMVVIDRQLERIELLKQEVEQRGFKWEETDIVNGTSDAKVTTQVVQEDATSNGAAQASGISQAENLQGGRLGDEELAQRLAERMMDEDEGMHL
jgi:hypothetical protein